MNVTSANFVGNGSHQNAGRRHHGIKAGAFAVAEVLAGIPDDGREADSFGCRVGGEPGVCQKYFTVVAHTLEFDVCAQIACRPLAPKHTVQNRQVVLDLLTLEALAVESEQLARGQLAGRKLFGGRGACRERMMRTVW